MLLNLLELDTCPHCGISNPTLERVGGILSTKSNSGYGYRWGIYACKKCGYLILARGEQGTGDRVHEIFPRPEAIDDSIPERPRAYLSQAILSLAAPSGCIMLCASSVDSMLKDKGYTKGSLYVRISKAIDDHLLTPEMGTWAHQIRLDANDERHADDNAELPDVEDARHIIKFTQALAEFLYVLPAKIRSGIEDTSSDPSNGI